MKAEADYVVHKKFGEIMRLTYGDGSRVYLSKKGLTITLPKSKFRKEWNKKSDNFGFTFNKTEIELLMKALDECDVMWDKFRKRKSK